MAADTSSRPAGSIAVVGGAAAAWAASSAQPTTARSCAAVASSCGLAITNAMAFPPAAANASRGDGSSVACGGRPGINQMTQSRAAVGRRYRGWSGATASFEFTGIVGASPYSDWGMAEKLKSSIAPARKTRQCVEPPNWK